MMAREGKDSVRAREEEASRKAREAARPPPIYYSEIPKRPEGLQIAVNLGYGGNWRKTTITKTIDEEDLNDVATGVFGP
jgi:CRISPR/Cas system CSM-associated protein Csm5 (group 7 of RAMP superfamily)